MKRIVILAIILAISCAAAAQPGKKKTHTPQQSTVAAVRDQIEFRSLHGETFMVYLDGQAVNTVPQSFVQLNKLDTYPHETIVVMQHPQQRAVVFSLSTAGPRGEVLVNYDRRSDRITLEPRSCNLSYYHNAPLGNHYDNRPHEQHFSEPVPPEPQIIVASEEEVASMVVRLKAQSFDSDRMALCRTMVPSAHLLSSQIARLADTFDFNSNQVEFLLFSFPYCIDPDNYYKTTDILTFSSDKKTVLDFINKNR